MKDDLELLLRYEKLTVSELKGLLNCVETLPEPGGEVVSRIAYSYLPALELFEELNEAIRCPDPLPCAVCGERVEAICKGSVTVSELPGLLCDVSIAEFNAAQVAIRYALKMKGKVKAMEKSQGSKRNSIAIVKAVSGKPGLIDVAFLMNNAISHTWVDLVPPEWLNIEDIPARLPTEVASRFSKRSH